VVDMPQEKKPTVRAARAMKREPNPNSDGVKGLWLTEKMGAWVYLRGKPVLLIDFWRDKEDGTLCLEVKSYFKGHTNFTLVK
jgi:hypothetical protein